jgi:hypothetical protein
MPRQKSPEEQLRERVNEAAVSVVAQGFAAIDELAEQGKNWLKRELIRAVSPPRKRKPRDRSHTDTRIL